MSSGPTQGPLEELGPLPPETGTHGHDHPTLKEIICIEDYGQDLLNCTVTNTHQSDEGVAGDDSILTRLFAAGLEDHTSDKMPGRFIPRCEVNTICNFDTVYQEVKALKVSDDKATTCAEYVCGPRESPSYSHLQSSRKVFATLVLSRLVELIFEFQEAGIRDKHLPLRHVSGKSPMLESHYDSDHLLLEFLDQPSRAWAAHEIFNKQWWVHVPYLARHPGRDVACDYTLHTETIMPWTNYPSDVVKGGFSVVRRIEIHPDHHNFRGNYQAFALKTFRNSDNHREKADFEREMKALRKVLTAPHLVELCATFASEGEYKLLFPWADGGSLQNLWTRPPTSLYSDQENMDPAKLMHWIATQLCGLMSGLQTIHQPPEGSRGNGTDGKPYGIHGDLKPENILHFSQEIEAHEFGVLKIADFGIAEFHSSGTRTIWNQDWKGPASPTYRSPEHEMAIPQMISRKVDIWSMGCVFSEMLVWALMGEAALQSYRDTRFNDSAGRSEWKEDNFFHREQPAPPVNAGEQRREVDKHILKPSVDKLLRHLMKRPCTTNSRHEQTFSQSFSKFIRNRMLVCQRESRAPCQSVIEFFRHELTQKSLDDWPYWSFEWDTSSSETFWDGQHRNHSSG